MCPFNLKANLIIISLVLSSSIGSCASNVYNSYNKGTYCRTEESTKFPNNVEEVQGIVRQAVTAGKKVKAVGRLGSNTDIICTDGIPVDLRNINYMGLNDDGSLATVGVGTQLTEFLEFLQSNGKSLVQVPSYGGITVGGALGAPSSGSSLLHPTFADLATQVTIVDGQGNVRVINNAAELQGFRMHLGLLGILIDVTFPTVPLFKMSVENFRTSDSVLTDGTALHWAETYDSLSLFWFPSSQSVVVAKGTYLPSNSDAEGTAETYLIPEEPSLVLTLFATVIEGLQAIRSRIGLAALQEFIQYSLYSQVVGRQAVYSENGGTLLTNPATGYAWKLMMNRCSNKCSWDNGDNSLRPEESNMAVEVSLLPNVTRMMKDTFTKIPAYNYMIGVFIRFSGESDTLLSPAYGRRSFSFDLVSAMRKDPFNDARDGLGAYQAILQSVLNEFEGRPHWGKNGLYFTSKDVIQQTSSSRVPQFTSLMEKYDPTGTFLNKFASRLLGESNEMSRDPRVTRCALQDFCVCSTNEDCARNQMCTGFKSSLVCKDNLLYPSLSAVIGAFIPTNLSSILPALRLI